MSESSQSQRRREIFKAVATVGLDRAGEKRGGFVNEFADANEVEIVSGDYEITYMVIAPDDKEAYRRAADLIEAKARAGGYGDNIQLKNVDTELTR